MSSKRCPLAHAGMLAYPHVDAVDAGRNYHVMCIEEDCAWWINDPDNPISSPGRCGVLPVFATLGVVEGGDDA